jgi:hypothetical protein
MTDKTNKTTIVDPDPNDLTAGYVDLPDGTVAFTPNGYARWRVPFAKIGIDIDKLMTHEEHFEYMTRVLEVCGHRTSAGAALLAILETDPVRKAQYEREAAPFRERADKMRRLGLRVVASGIKG